MDRQALRLKYLLRLPPVSLPYATNSHINDSAAAETVAGGEVKRLSKLVNKLNLQNKW